MISFLLSIALFWYFFNFIDNNSYIKNVAIYAIVNFILVIIEQAFSGAGFTIFSSIISSIIGGLILVKIMEFTRSRTNTLVTFVLLTSLCNWVISFCIAFISFKILF